MRHREMVCPYDHPDGEKAPVLVIRPSNHVAERRIGGQSLKPRVTPGADVHCTVCHYESWIPVPDDWQPGDLELPRVCSCGEVYF